MSPADRRPRSPFVGDSEMAARMGGADWAATPLGPVEGWPQSLRTALEICLRCRFPMVIFWGPELAQLYNDSYLQILGAKHPASLGQPAAQCWAEIWPVIGGMLTGVIERGQSTFDEDLRLDVRRYGVTEEAYFTFSYSPILVASGEVGGVFCAVAETTGKVIGTRRLAALRELGAGTAGARSAGQACERAASAMSRHRADVPYGLVYLAADGTQARAVASWGLPAPVSARYAEIALDDPAAALPLGWAQETGVALTVERPQGLPAPAVVVLPACPGGDAGPPAFLAAGVSPLRELDAEYRSFLDLLAGQLAAAVTAAHAYESAQQRLEALAELDRIKTEFFSNVSHEFRTPLTLILGTVEQLQAALAPRADARLGAELEVLHRNGLRLGKLVNTLLDFASIQTGRMQASYEPVELGAVTAELASVFRSAIERAGLEFVVDCPLVGEPVYVDREMWEKVMLNLLSNAVKFTFDGRITVVVRRSERCAVVSVADTGTGVPAEELPRLFDRFHRIRGARARSHEGSGIGLALVAELVALHGGAITAESTLEVGTTFTVTLPLGHAHLPADQVMPASAATRTSEVAAPFVAEALRWLPCAPETAPETLPETPWAAPVPIGLTQGRVLLADDNADMREYLQRLLAPRYQVQTVPDGLAARDAAVADPPDLIVSDVMMPGMDGLQLLAALRADERTARVPVLLLSARAGQEAAIEGMAAGADDYLVKPFSAQELLARVGAHLQLGRMRREAEERFRVMADLAPALIWVADPQGGRVFCNRGWQEFTGGEPSAHLGAGWQAAVHPGDLPRYQAVVSQALAEEAPWRIEYRLRRAGDVYHWVLEHAVPIGERGSLAGYAGSAVDINTQYRETERQTLLAALGEALDAEGVAQRMDRVTQLLVERRVADQCTIIRAVPGQGLQRIAVAAIDADTAAALAAAFPDTPAARQVREAGRALLITEVTGEFGVEADLGPEQLALRQRIGWHSVIVAPLLARGQTLGVLIVGRQADSARYDTDDLALLEEIAQRSAVALDNALLLARLELLGQATAALSAAATPREVAQTALDQFARLLGADAVAVYELRETRALELLAEQGWHAGDDWDWQTLPLDGHPTPATDAARLHRPVWLESIADWRAAYPDLARVMTELGFSAAANLPLLVGERCIGTLAIGFTCDRALEGGERAAATSLAEQCAQALHRAQLLAAETAARLGAEQFSRLVAALSGATEVADVAQVILDYAADLGALAAVVVCRGARGQLPVLATRGYPSIPGAPLGAAELRIDAAHPLAHAVRTAQAVWLGSRSVAAWRHRAFDPDGLLPVQVALPLIVDNTAIGALGLRFADPAPVFAPQERAMILTLAGQCGQALERARLYQAEHEIAQTLQRSLLPQQLPQFDRLALAACYLPGAQHVTAGGDWYDVLDLEQGRVAIVVGDVVGQGAAAAAVVGQLRTALATALLHGDSPAVALQHLNRLAAHIPGARTSTVAAAILDLNTGQLRWARAGHPPPLLLSGGTARYLTGGLGAPLGAACRTPLTDATTRLEPGQSLLLYTDGLIERRHRIIDEGLDRLAATAAPLHGEPPHTLVTQLLAHALPESGPPDDIALITARYLPGPLHQRLRADPAELTGLRRTVRAWIRAAALPAELGEDLHIALGEAAANAAEHAYPAGSEPGEFTYQLTHCGDGAIEVEVRDFGCWRPEPPDNQHRGRGLAMIRKVARDVVIDPAATGTHVGFRLPAPPPVPGPLPAPRDQLDRLPPPTPATLHTHLPPEGGRRLALRGELDLTSVASLRELLLEQLYAPGPVTLDLTALDYLSSAGVGLLIDATHHAATHHVPLQIQLSAGSIPARILALSGLENTLPLHCMQRTVHEHEGAGCGSHRDDEGERVAELGSEEAPDRPGDHDAEVPERGHRPDRRTWA